MSTTEGRTISGYRLEQRNPCCRLSKPLCHLVERRRDPEHYLETGIGRSRELGRHQYRKSSHLYVIADQCGSFSRDDGRDPLEEVLALVLRLELVGGGGGGGVGLFHILTS